MFSFQLFRSVVPGPFVVAVVVFIAACGSGLVSDPTSGPDLATVQTSATQSESTYIQLSPSPTLTPIIKPSRGPLVRTVPVESSTLVKSSSRPTVLDQVRVLVDSAGREVKVPQQVVRLVSLSPSATEILFAIGAGEQLVGVDDFSNFPAAAKKLERLGSFTPDLERIVAMEPDLVIAAEIVSSEIVEQLTTAGVSVWIVDSPDVRGVAESIRRLGGALGRESTADVVATDLERRLERLIEIVAGLTDRPRVFYELDASDPMKPFTVGPGNFVNDLLTLAGAANVFADASVPFPQVGFEAVLVRDPELIILADGPFGITAESVKGRTGWDALSAVRDGRILEVTPELGDMISRPGPRIADGLAIVARFIHPDVFPK